MSLPIGPLTIAFSGWTPDLPKDFGLINANGLQFAFLEAGPVSGPLVLCLHGFPDDAYTFDLLTESLVADGYRVVCPFMRGYYPTQIPMDDDYSVETLARDAIALIEAFGAARAFVIGHDWGAITGYVMANIAPERVSRLVALAIPHPRALRPSWTQLRASYQFVELPWGGRSVQLLERNGYRYLDETYARWSPGWEGPEVEALAARMKQNFARPGRAAAALGYYRWFRRDLLNLRRVALYRSRTSVPTLVLHGPRDGSGSPIPFARTSSAFTGPYRQVEIPGTGHFLHREAPERVAAEIGAFLRG